MEEPQDMIKDKADLLETSRKLMQPSEANLGKLLFQFKRLFDEWALANLESDGFPSIKLAYMPVLMRIGHAGITNKALAAQIHISKQAMSKTLREVKALNLIEERPNPDDARSNILELTNPGLELVIFVKQGVNQLCEKYKERVGQERFEAFLSVMGELVLYHEEINLKKFLRNNAPD